MTHSTRLSSITFCSKPDVSAAVRSRWATTSRRASRTSVTHARTLWTLQGRCRAIHVICERRRSWRRQAAVSTRRWAKKTCKLLVLCSAAGTGGVPGQLNFCNSRVEALKWWEWNLFIFILSVNPCTLVIHVMMKTVRWFSLSEFISFLWLWQR